MKAPERARTRLSGVLLLTVVSGPYGCGEAGRPTSDVEVETVGDTLVVRTVQGRVWADTAELVPEVRIGVREGPDPYLLGDVRALAAAPGGGIYVLDGQVPVLRQYSADGGYLRTLGRPGRGPGEYTNPDGGMGVLPNGRVLLRDPANGRILVWGPDGDWVASWTLEGGTFSDRPLYVDRAGSFRADAWVHSANGSGRALIRRDPSGAVTDTTFLPDLDVAGGELSAVRDGVRMAADVPFWPAGHWTVDPDGNPIVGIATRYAFTVERPGGAVLRIERRAPDIPVQPPEAADARSRVEEDFRRRWPGWDWDGAEVPRVKPPYKGLHASRDGRVWVHRPAPGLLLSNPADPGEARWTEPVVFDVFEADGTYLGPVRAPEGLSTSPPPTIDGDGMWAVVRDAYDVQSVVRLRLEHH